MCRRPLVGIAVSTAIGVASGLAFETPVPLILLLVLLSLVISFITAQYRVSIAIVHVAAYFTGYACALTMASPISPSDVHALLEDDREFVKLVGTVVDDPLFDAISDEVIEYTLDVRALQRIDSFRRIRGSIRIRQDTRADDIRYEYGDLIYAEGVLARPAHQGTSRLRHRLTLHVADGRSRLIAEGEGNPIRSACYRARRACAATLSHGIEAFPAHTGLLRALLLGYKGALPDRLEEAFSSTGTLHIFAISGLHVGVVATFLTMLLRALGISRRYGVLIVGPMLMGYTMMTGMKVSAIRACIMALAFGSAYLFHRKPDALSSLAAAGIVILLFAPQQLIDPGFIYSFTIVMALIVCYTPVARTLNRIIAPDPWRDTKKLGWRRVVHNMGKRCAALAATSIIAWFCSAPLTATFFNIASPIALLGNMLVIPAAFLILLTGSLSICLGSMSVVLAEVFNHANRAFISALLYLIDLLAAVPHGHLSVSSPGWVAVGLWYMSWLFILFKRGVSKWVVSGILLLVLVGMPFISSVGRSPEITIVNHAGRHTTLVSSAGCGKILIDAAPRTWRNLLRRGGINRLHVLILTDLEQDRIDAAVEILGEIPLKALWIPDGLVDTDAVLFLLEEARGCDVPIRHLHAGHRGQLGRNIDWEVLTSPQAHRGGLSIRLSNAASSVIVLGTWRASVEDALIRSSIELGKPVVIIGLNRYGNRQSRLWSLFPPERLLVPESNHGDSVVGKAEVVDAFVRQTRRGDTLRVLLHPRGLEFMECQSF